MRRILIAVAALAVGAALLLGVSCGGGGDEDEAAVEAAIRAIIEAANADDIEGFLAHITDEGIADLSGGFVSSKEELRQAHEAGEAPLNEPPTDQYEIRNIQVSGDTATAELDARSGQTRTVERGTLVREADAWLLDSVETLRIPAPSGATEAEVGLVEFAFNLTQLSFPAGDVAFQVTNSGQQPHQMGIAKLPEGVSLQEALEAEDPDALGLEDVADFDPIEPGAEATWIVEDLDPGRYGYACFVTDPADGTPHALKGMVGEFTVD